MKVKELIEKLKKCDPEKNIWVFYDQFTFLTPELGEITEEDVAGYPGNYKSAIGDYKLEGL